MSRSEMAAAVALASVTVVGHRDGSRHGAVGGSDREQR
jgi:hypothetical protein